MSSRPARARRHLHFKRLTFSFLAALGVTACALSAQSPGDEPIVTTHHSVTVGGRTLAYTARAGRIAIRDNDDGSAHGQMFFVSYTLDRPANAPPRPITFAWNGGPGSNAGLVHLIGFGPKRIAPHTGATHWSVIPNDGTWLDFTDLVFVDPIGTGYSRVTKPEYMHEFYSTRGDAESVAEFIRVWRARYGNPDAPLFLAGESYGVTRASNVADALEGRDTHVRGVILMGLEPPLGHISDTLRAALEVPSYTVAALTHGRLAADLQSRPDVAMQQSEQWSRDVYAGALARAASLGDAERDSVRRTLSRYTGLDASAIDHASLVVPYPRFGATLLRGDGKFVGLYDVRMTGPLDTVPGPYDPRTDPSLMHLTDPVTMLRYFRDELGYRNDLAYQGPWGGSYPPPATFRGDWMSVRWDWKADTLIHGSPLEHAMASDTAMKVLVVCGMYDLVCPYAVVEEKLRGVSPRVRWARLAGGHAVYTDDRARLALKQAARELMR